MLYQPALDDRFTADNLSFALARLGEKRLVIPPARVPGSRLKPVCDLRVVSGRSSRSDRAPASVSNDNVYAESLFRTAKYWPEFPAQGFANGKDTVLRSRIHAIRLLGRANRRVAPALGRRSTARDGCARVLRPACRRYDQLLRTTLGGVQEPLMIDGSAQ